jgi:acetylornithine/N-succinyldiaminopimelate aminotransferase
MTPLFPDVPTADLARRATAVMTPNYKPLPIVLTGGSGARVRDRDGRVWVDMVAGIAVNALGHGHPRLSRAISEQASEMIHISNLYLNEPAIALAERLVATTFADRVFFCNSGAEANEAALKLARRYQTTIAGAPGKTGILAFHHSFHGRTFGALSVTGQPKYHKGFEPLVPGVVFARFGDLDDVTRVLDSAPTPVGTVIVEPIQCEGGINVAPAGFFAELRALCDARGILISFDEVQTGVGRTGRLFCYEHLGMQPDILTTAKGIAGGLPLGAMLCSEKVAAGFEPGSHATTFGGNALATRAGLEVLSVIEDEGLLANAQRVGGHLGCELAGLVARHPGKCSAQRGLGLVQGLELADRSASGGPSADAFAMTVMTTARERGLLINIVQGRTLRFVPPLVTTEADVDAALAILEGILAEA